MRKKLVQKIVFPILASAWVYIAVFMIAAIVVVTTVSWGLGDAFEPFAESTVGNLLLSGLIYVFGAAVVILPLLARKPSKAELREVLGMNKKLTLGMFGSAMLAWAAYFVLSIAVVIVLAVLRIPGLDLSEGQVTGYENIKTVGEYLLTFVGLVILPPIFEEIIFRGYLYGQVRTWWRFVAASLLTSIVFGVVHGQWNVGIDVFILSMFMCFLREKYQSIWPTIIMHMTKNGIAYVLLFIWPVAQPYVEQYLRTKI